MLCGTTSKSEYCQMACCRRTQACISSRAANGRIVISVSCNPDYPLSEKPFAPHHVRRSACHDNSQSDCSTSRLSSNRVGYECNCRDDKNQRCNRIARDTVRAVGIWHPLAVHENTCG